MANATQVRLLTSNDLPLVERLLNTSEFIYQRFTLEELPMLLKHYPAVGMFNGDSMSGFLLSQTVKSSRSMDRRFWCELDCESRVHLSPGNVVRTTAEAHNQKRRALPVLLRERYAE